MTWPPQDVHGTYPVALFLRRGGAVVTLPRPALVLIDSRGRSILADHHAPLVGSGLFAWLPKQLATGPFRLQLTLDGLVVQMEPEFASMVVEPSYAGGPAVADGHTRVFIHETLEELAVPVTVTLRAGGEVIGGGVLKCGELEFLGDPTRRAWLAPGTRTLELLHATHELAPQQAVIRIDRSPVAFDLEVRPSVVTESLRIVGSRFLASVGEDLDFRVDPLPAGPAVWTSSDDAVLRPGAPPGRFRVLRAGAVEIRVRAGNQSGRASVALRASETESVLPPFDPVAVSIDPATGIVTSIDRLLVRFHAHVVSARRLQVVNDLGLAATGELVEDHVLVVRIPRDPDLDGWARRIRARPEVDLVCRNTVVGGQSGRASTFLPHVPPKIDAAGGTPDQRRVKFWNHFKIGSPSAFGVLTQRQVPQKTMYVLDSGLVIRDNGQFDENLELPTRRVALDACATVRWDVLTLATASSADDFVRSLRDEHEKKHGNRMATLTVPALSPPPRGVVGMYPWGQVAMYKARHTDRIQRLLRHAKQLPAGEMRVMNISMGNDYGPENAALTAADNALIQPAVHGLMKNGWLLVFAAGDKGQSVRDCSFASIGAVYNVPEDYPGAFLVVGATHVPVHDTYGDPEGRELKLPISNFDGPGLAPLVDLAAPGHEILASTDEGYQWSSGTSEAAAQVSAVAALLGALLPAYTAKEIKQLILDSADPFTIVEPAQYPSSMHHLQSPRGKSIGEGRLNMWEAVLRALEVADGRRYFGMRIAYWKPDLEVHLIYDGIPPPPHVRIPELTREHRPDRTTDLRITLSDAEPLPRALETFEKDNGPRVHAFDLYFRPGKRRVRWYRLWGGGRSEIHWIGDERGYRLRLRNAGERPTDPDFLDPERQDPENPDIRPWQKLANGDSFALRATVLEDAPGALVRWFDGSGATLPGDQVDDRGNPYVTIPFGEEIELAAQLRGPAAVIGRRVRVKLEVWSLNNTVVRHEREVLLEVPASPLFDVTIAARTAINAPAWPLWADVEIAYRGAARRLLTLRHEIQPTGWSLAAEAPGWFEPGQTKTIRVRVQPPDQAPGSAAATLAFDADEPGVVYTQGVSFETRRPTVAVEPASLRIANVVEVPQANEVEAVARIRIANSSPFPVQLRRDFHSGSQTLPSRFEIAGIPWADDKRYTLASGGSVSALLRLTYQKQLALQQPPLIDVREVGMALLDPQQLSQHVDFDSCSRSKLEIRLKLPGTPVA